MMPEAQIRRIVEAALLTAPEPISVARLARMFAADELPADGAAASIRAALAAIREDAEGRGYELAEVASGFRLQVRQELAPWLGRLFEERPPRYSRALLETLAAIVYRQPATRGDIEAVRGVAVSPSIMRTLLERGWIRAVGQRETPGRPTMYGTTRGFLDYFNLRGLNELPPLDEIRSLVESPADADDDDAPPQAEASPPQAEATPPDQEAPQADDGAETA